ncbi:MAG: T9SS type A sorting domain-containing protein [Bacteroidetes bacterium]|nr:T9SS type A sorting domain-containing protein [Bacteroidota bacterium]
MKISIRVTLIIFTSILYLNIYSQNIQYEINIVDDSVDIFPDHFTRGLDDCIIGIVNKAAINDTINPFYYSTIYKLDQEGDTLSKCFEKEDTVFACNRIITIHQGNPGYLLTGNGYHKDSSYLNKFVIFIRLDQDLNVVWQKIYSFGLIYWGGYYSRTLVLKDGSFLYCFCPGYSLYTGLFKLSASGDSLAYNYYESDSAGNVWGLTYSPDSLHYWVHTEFAHYYSGPQICSRLIVDTNLVQIGHDFFPAWLRTPFGVKMYYDGSLLVSGSTIISHPYTDDEFYISAHRLDTSFNIMYGRNFTDPDTNSRGAEIESVDYYYPGAIFIGGTHYLQGITGQNPNWFYLTRLNDTLGVEYEKYIGGDDYYWLTSVVATTDGGVLLAGTKETVGGIQLHRNGYIIKFDSTGCQTEIPEGSMVQVKEALVYPNPGNSFLTVRTANKGCTLVLYNQLGYTVFEKRITSIISTYNVESLAAGTYYYSIIQNNKSIDSGTWIKQ